MTLQISILETLHANYVERIEATMRRMGAEHSRLSALDLFEMDEKKAAWTQRRLGELEQDLLLLNDCSHMSTAMWEAWEAQSNARAEQTFWWARNEYERKAREARDYRHLYLEMLDICSALNENLIALISNLTKSA